MSKLTQEEKCRRIHAALGKDEWLLKKQGLYWRPDSCGYTDRIAEAGRYSHEEAMIREYKRGTPNEWVTVEPAPVPDYFGDLNPCHAAEKMMTAEQQERYYAELAKQKSFHEWVSATATQRAEALGKTLELWEEGE